eukprot:m51a1_g12145 hypothetical protein (191) ;mRNA; f:4394-5451
MGVQDLMKFAVEHRLGSRKKLADLASHFQEEANAGARGALVVDGSALVHWVSRTCREPSEFGGQSSHELRRTREFVRLVRAAAPASDVVVVFDGRRPEAKDDEARRRVVAWATDAEAVWRAVRAAAAAPKRSPITALFASSVVALGLQQEGATVVYAEGEADSEIARQAERTHAWGVLSDDSDLLHRRRL